MEIARAIFLLASLVLVIFEAHCLQDQVGVLGITRSKQGRNILITINRNAAHIRSIVKNDKNSEVSENKLVNPNTNKQFVLSEQAKSEKGRRIVDVFQPKKQLFHSKKTKSTKRKFEIGKVRRRLGAPFKLFECGDNATCMVVRRRRRKSKIRSPLTSLARTTRRRSDPQSRLLALTSLKGQTFISLWYITKKSHEWSTRPAHSPGLQGILLDFYIIGTDVWTDICEQYEAMTVGRPSGSIYSFRGGMCPKGALVGATSPNRKWF